MFEGYLVSKTPKKSAVPVRAATTLAIVAFLMALAAPVTSAAANRHVASTVKKGLAFYKGKSITLISPDKPGGSFNQWARLIAPYLGAYLHATVNVTNISPGVTIAGQDAAARAVPDGLTIGFLNEPEDAANLAEHIPGVNFNPARVAILAGLPTISSPVVAKPGSPYTSWGALVHSASPVPELGLPTGTETDILLLMNAAFGIKAHFITGYTETVDVINGFQRGDGDVFIAPPSTTGSLVEHGQGVGIVQTGSAQRGSTYFSTFKNVPSVEQLMKRYPATTQLEKKARKALVAFIGLPIQVLFAPSATPAARVTALRIALKHVLSNPGLKTAALNQGLSPGYIPGSQAKANYIKAIKVTAPMGPYFKASV